MTSAVPDPSSGLTLDATLAEMHRQYVTDPVRAVRGQHFIKLLHHHIAVQFDSRLHPDARSAGVYVKEEAAILGSHKSKDVDVAVMHPTSGPLILTGVRSQMSSVGKNVLTYYQDIVGEAVSLQERYPMTVHSYAYLHPLKYPEEQKATKTRGARTLIRETNVDRYAKMYRAITGRDDKFYRVLSGIYDQFAYLVVDFDQSPAQLRDDLVAAAVDVDLSIKTFVERIISTYKRRNIWFDLFV